jgi:hypothetical protein
MGPGYCGSEMEGGNGGGWERGWKKRIDGGDERKEE